jgi:7-carboxy-7-deazaguanine synthase
VTLYRVNDIFGPTLQGEGMRAGSAAVFLRFAGCNLRCSLAAGDLSPGGFDCDTEFRSYRTMSAEAIWAAVSALAGPVQWIIVSGGEPALQLDRALVDHLHGAGFRLAIETNGTVDVSGLGLDWITCSPKVAEHAVKVLEANEVKYVRNYGQGIPQPRCRAPEKYISPASSGDGIDRRALAWCVQLVKENPEWRLTWQAHKLWGVP